MRRLRHLARLLRDLWAFGRAYKVYWMVPLALVLLATAAIIVVSQGALPFVYTLF
jgi:hypothetical protein